MDKTIKKFTIPKCLEKTPEVFGLSIQTAVTTLGLILAALIVIAKSIWISLLILGIAFCNLKLAKKFKKMGGVLSYLFLLIEKQESISVNCKIESLIQINKNNNGR